MSRETDVTPSPSFSPIARKTVRVVNSFGGR
jgi:hypothetical protein